MSNQNSTINSRVNSVVLDEWAILAPLVTHVMQESHDTDVKAQHSNKKALTTAASTNLERQITIYTGAIVVMLVWKYNGQIENGKKDK